MRRTTIPDAVTFATAGCGRRTAPIIESHRKNCSLAVCRTFSGMWNVTVIISRCAIFGCGESHAIFGAVNNSGPELKTASRRPDVQGGRVREMARSSASGKTWRACRDTTAGTLVTGTLAQISGHGTNSGHHFPNCVARIHHLPD